MVLGPIPPLWALFSGSGLYIGHTSKFGLGSIGARKEKYMHSWHALCQHPIYMYFSFRCFGGSVRCAYVAASSEARTGAVRHGPPGNRGVVLTSLGLRVSPILWVTSDLDPPGAGAGAERSRSGAGAEPERRPDIDLIT